MKYLLYCIMGFDCESDAMRRQCGHLHWFNPNLVCCAEAHEENGVAKVILSGSCGFWCELGSWQSIVDEIHTHYKLPSEVKIQEVVVTK